jgi:hypothetical protein
MTERLKQAVENVAAALLPEEQDQLADSLLRMLDADDEALWDAAFADSGEKLDCLADQALDDFRAGRTTPLDPEKL